MQLRQDAAIAPPAKAPTDVSNLHRRSPDAAVAEDHPQLLPEAALAAEPTTDEAMRGRPLLTAAVVQLVAGGAAQRRHPVCRSRWLKPSRGWVAPIPAAHWHCHLP